MAKNDYYQTLGVSKTATESEIKKAYHKLAKKHHPDKHQHDKKERAEAEKKFKEIQGAYDIIGDPEKRKMYDQFGEAAFQGGTPNPGQQGWHDAFGQGGHGQEGPFAGGGGLGGLDEILKRMMNQQAGAGRGRARGRQPQVDYSGQNIETTMTIPLRTAIRGGSMAIGGPSGELLTITIPAGVKEGAKLRLAGKGQPSPLGGPPGDLLIQIQTESDPVFTRDGTDISVELPISVSEAVLGAAVDVPSLDGPVSVTIPPGASSGQKLRLKGKGGPKPEGGNGDQYVQIKVVVPKNVDAESRKLIEEFAKRNPQEPRANLHW